jgi:hypothetical protein
LAHATKNNEKKDRPLKFFTTVPNYKLGYLMKTATQTPVHGPASSRVTPVFFRSAN